jgi:DNA-binding CsgD family transcriptional regulator
MLGLFQQTAAKVENYCKLSLRELEVIDYLAAGLRYKEIADKLNISYATVHTHIRHICKKMKVDSRTDAVSLHLRHVAGWQNNSKVIRPQPVVFLNQIGIPGKAYQITATYAY